MKDSRELMGIRGIISAAKELVGMAEEEEYDMRSKNDASRFNQLPPSYKEQLEATALLILKGEYYVTSYEIGGDRCWEEKTTHVRIGVATKDGTDIDFDWGGL